MAVRLFALIPALLLTDMAPAPGDALAECRLGYDAMRAAIASLPLDHKIDESKDGNRDIFSYFAGPMPTLFGIPATGFGAADTLDSNGERFMLITTVKVPFPQLHAAVTAAHGPSSCAVISAGRCAGTLRVDGDRRIGLLAVTDGDEISIACIYTRTRS